MTPVQQAEMFAMCMAEAGFALGACYLDVTGTLRHQPRERHVLRQAAYWRAVLKARQIAGRIPIACCEECYVARKVANPHDRPGLSPCEHVEVDA